MRLAAAIRRHPTVVDSAIAALLAVATVPQLVYWAKQPGGGFAERLVFTVLLVAPITLRRRHPLSTFAFAAAVALVQWNLNITLAADVVLLVYLYTVASRYPTRVGVLAAAIVEVGVVMAAIRWNLAGDLAQPWPQRVLFLSGPVAVALLLGVSVRGRRQTMAALRDRAERLERERDQQAMLAVAAERTRIAREMHDVVAHSLSVMVTLSDAAALKQTVDPQRALVAMRQVSATGHTALDEMRRLLGVLRSDDGSEVRQPQPGMVQIHDLIDQVRAAGLGAEFTITGTRVDMPLGAELTVYRIVQEAITNTLKHAVGPTRVTVVVSFQPDSVIVDVHDNGAFGNPSQTTSQGFGLTGMRERVAVYGGSVSAGPDPTGGWRVRTLLPVTTSALASRTANAHVQ